MTGKVTCRAGDTVRFLRDYDRFKKGSEVKIAWGGEIEPHVASDLCLEAADGRGPFAEKVRGKGDDDGGNEA